MTLPPIPGRRSFLPQLTVLGLVGLVLVLALVVLRSRGTADEASAPRQEEKGAAGEKSAQEPHKAPFEDHSSGGPLRPLQATYDVRRYELEIAIVPESKSIRGHAATIAVALAPLETFELQLDGRLDVSRAEVDGGAATFTHQDGIVAVALPSPWAAGERHRVELDYGGQPKVAARPPWDDGFVWSETPSGAPWLAVTTQGDGADLWWPCKDHPSDEPDEGISMALTVPSALVGLSNGRKVGETVNGDGTTTTRWEVGYPINNYDVTFNAAPYVPIETTYHGIDGTLEVPILFWSIPEHVEPATRMWKEQGAKILAVLGRRFGEYPFLDDKYWVVDAPYLGMEHQTLVAYGSKFENNEYGADWLLLHETAHEWWGNKITARDWADFWIHEGFAVYSEAVFVEDTLGYERYLEFMAKVRKGVHNDKPIVGGRDLTTAEAYVGDIYPKGAATLHTLRWLLGDELFFDVLHTFATDARFAYKLTSSAEFEQLVAAKSGHEIPWFWRRYLETAAPPRWTMTRTAAGEGRERIELAWDDPTFELPLPVAVDGEERRIGMPGGRGALEVAAGAEVEVDPRGKVLAEPAGDGA